MALLGLRGTGGRLWRETSGGGWPLLARAMMAAKSFAWRTPSAGDKGSPKTSARTSTLPSNHSYRRRISQYAPRYPFPIASTSR